MIQIIVNKDYQNVQVISNSLEKLDNLLTYMKRKIYESIGHRASVLDLYEWAGVSFLDTNAEMMNWVWENLEEAKIERDFDNYTLSMPSAKKISMLKLTAPYKEMCINVPRGCGKSMSAMKMIEDICENTKLREEINSKIKKYSDMDHYGYRFTLEYQHQSRGKKYRVEYRVPFDSPCFLEFWPDEEVDKYLDGKENKARKELIDRVIKDINKGDANNMPTHMEMELKAFDISKYIVYPRNMMTISNDRIRLPKITNIEMYNDRVVKVTFDDGSFTKSVCQENDIFDLDVGITVCLMKKMLDSGKGDGTRIYNDIIRDAHKLIEDKENEKIEKQLEKESQKKKARKAQMKKQAKKLKAKEEAIDIQKQAYIRALKETGMISDAE